MSLNASSNFRRTDPFANMVDHLFYREDRPSHLVAWALQEMVASNLDRELKAQGYSVTTSKVHHRIAGRNFANFGANIQNIAKKLTRVLLNQATKKF